MSGLFKQSDDLSGYFVRVAVERSYDRGGTDAALTYRADAPIAPGRRVEVPLGRGNTAAAGIVIESGGVEVIGGIDPDKIKPIIRETGAALSTRLVELARWMSSYYVCPLGMVLSSMLPAAVKQDIGRRKRIRLDRVDAEQESRLNEIKMTPRVREAWAAVVALGREAMPLEPRALADRIHAPTLGGVNALVRHGLLREIEDDVVRAFGAESEIGTLEQSAAPRTSDSETGLELTHEQSAAVEGIGAGLAAFGVHLIRGVTGSGKTEVYLRVIHRTLALGRTALVLVPEISLTPQTAGRFQARFSGMGVAVLHSGLSASQRHREWQRAGSGDARVVVGARSAVFAPLDSLGMIVVDEEHAGDYKQDQLPRYHGRDVAIKRAQLEGCPVILGSATPSLESWMNAAAPNGRSDSAPAAKYRLWELPNRVGGGNLPKVEVVNIRDEQRERIRIASARGQRPSRSALADSIGPTLESAIDDCIRHNGQVLLLLNRRGYSSHILCSSRACGWVMQCDDCDACLVEHRSRAFARPDDPEGAPDTHNAPGAHPAPSDQTPRRFLRCHHCLAQQRVPKHCPLCAQSVVLLGAGTQRLEEEVRARFAPAVADWKATSARTGDTTLTDSTADWLVRADGDTMKSGRDWFGVLDRLARGHIRVLLGTQMIAKGLDFPNVRLVGVINADTALTLPDFRAAERTFQLVSQVAGRAGRGVLPGRVIVQTYEPDAPVIRHAANHDFVSFAREELDDRRRIGLPPAVRMARIVLRDRDATKADRTARDLAELLRAEAPPTTTTSGLRVLGPSPCPISRIGGFHRRSIELFAPHRGSIQQALSAVRAKGWLKSDAHTAIDVDPIALM